MRVVHEVGLKVQPQLAALALVHVHGLHRAVRRLQLDRQPRVVGIIFIIQHIGDGIAVDGHQPVARMRGAAQGAVRVHMADRTAVHRRTSFPGFGHSKRRGASAPLLSFLLLADLDNVASVVLAACLAGVVGQNKCAAVRALHNRGSRELPVGRASLVTSLSGYFSFRDCHVDTSSSVAVLSSFSS